MKNIWLPNMLALKASVIRDQRCPASDQELPCPPPVRRGFSRNPDLCRELGEISASHIRTATIQTELGVWRPLWGL